MGGRGASSKRGTGGAGGGSSDGVIMSNKPVTIETDYRTRGNGAYGEYRKEIPEAKTDGSGNVTFSWANAVSFERESKKSSKVTFELIAGAVDGNTFNINWNKVNSISGQTYGLRHAAKEAGLKWDGAKKIWRR